jgi:hypothetical protein
VKLTHLVLPVVIVAVVAVPSLAFADLKLVGETRADARLNEFATGLKELIESGALTREQAEATIVTFETMLEKRNVLATANLLLVDLEAKDRALVADHQAATELARANWHLLTDASRAEIKALLETSAAEIRALQTRLARLREARSGAYVELSTLLDEKLDLLRQALAIVRGHAQ